MQLDLAIDRGEIPMRVRFGLWVLLKDADRAFRDFDTSLLTQDIEFLWTDETQFLRSDPRFAQLLESLEIADQR